MSRPGISPYRVQVRTREGWADVPDLGEPLKYVYVEEALADLYVFIAHDDREHRVIQVIETVSP